MVRILVVKFTRKFVITFQNLFLKKRHEYHVIRAPGDISPQRGTMVLFKTFFGKGFSTSTSAPTLVLALAMEESVISPIGLMIFKMFTV